MTQSLGPRPISGQFIQNWRFGTKKYWMNFGPRKRSFSGKLIQADYQTWMSFPKSILLLTRLQTKKLKKHMEVYQAWNSDEFSRNRPENGFEPLLGKLEFQNIWISFPRFFENSFLTLNDHFIYFALFCRHFSKICFQKWPILSVYGTINHMIFEWNWIWSIENLKLKVINSINMIQFLDMVWIAV